MKDRFSMLAEEVIKEFFLLRDIVLQRGLLKGKELQLGRRWWWRAGEKGEERASDEA